MLCVCSVVFVAWLHCKIWPFLKDFIAVLDGTEHINHTSPVRQFFLTEQQKIGRSGKFAECELKLPEDYVYRTSAGEAMNRVLQDAKQTPKNWKITMWSNASMNLGGDEHKAFANLLSVLGQKVNTVLLPEITELHCIGLLLYPLLCTEDWTPRLNGIASRMQAAQKVVIDSTGDVFLKRYAGDKFANIRIVCILCFTHCLRMLVSVHSGMAYTGHQEGARNALVIQAVDIGGAAI